MKDGGGYWDRCVPEDESTTTDEQSGILGGQQNLIQGHLKPPYTTLKAKNVHKLHPALLLLFLYSS